MEALKLTKQQQIDVLTAALVQLMGVAKVEAQPEREKRRVRMPATVVEDGPGAELEIAQADDGAVYVLLAAK